MRVITQPLLYRVLIIFLATLVFVLLMRTKESPKTAQNVISTTQQQYFRNAISVSDESTHPLGNEIRVKISFTLDIFPEWESALISVRSEMNDGPRVRITSFIQGQNVAVKSKSAQNEEGTEHSLSIEDKEAEIVKGLSIRILKKAIDVEARMRSYELTESNLANLIMQMVISEIVDMEMVSIREIKKICGLDSNSFKPDLPPSPNPTPMLKSKDNQSLI
jgi:hypothetical protein